MIKIDSLLSQDCTLCAVPGKSKKFILQQISDLAATKIHSSTAKDLLISLTNREKLGSTGIGKGIAIPHGKISNDEQAVAVLVTVDKPILFDAIDDKPVDIFFALFVPENSCEQHLQTLASVAQFFSDKENSKQVRRCQNSQQLFKLITQA